MLVVNSLTFALIKRMNRDCGRAKPPRALEPLVKLRAQRNTRSAPSSNLAPICTTTPHLLELALYILITTALAQVSTMAPNDKAGRVVFIGNIPYGMRHPYCAGALLTFLKVALRNLSLKHSAGSVRSITSAWSTTRRQDGPKASVSQSSPMLMQQLPLCAISTTTTSWEGSYGSIGLMRVVPEIMRLRIETPNQR